MHVGNGAEMCLNRIELGTTASSWAANFKIFVPGSAFVATSRFSHQFNFKKAVAATLAVLTAMVCATSLFQKAYARFASQVLAYARP